MPQDSFYDSWFYKYDSILQNKQYELWTPEIILVVTKFDNCSLYMYCSFQVQIFFASRFSGLAEKQT